MFARPQKYMKQQIAKLKAENPKLDHKERFLQAAKGWSASPEYVSRRKKIASQLDLPLIPVHPTLHLTATQRTSKKIKKLKKKEMVESLFEAARSTCERLNEGHQDRSTLLKGSVSVIDAGQLPLPALPNFCRRSSAPDRTETERAVCTAFAMPSGAHRNGSGQAGRPSRLVYPGLLFEILNTLFL